MTIAKMNEYFEKAGFEVTRQYLSNERRYKFTITKNNISHTGYFVYGDHVDYKTRDTRQLQFIHDMIAEFNAKAQTTKERYEKTTKDMFRHFVRRLGTTSGIEISITIEDDRDKVDAIKKTDFGELTKSYVIIWNEVEDLNAAYDAIVNHLADEKTWIANYDISDMYPDFIYYVVGRGNGKNGKSLKTAECLAKQATNIYLSTQNPYINQLALYAHLFNDNNSAYDFLKKQFQIDNTNEEKENSMKIKHVHFSGPCTVVIWEDGTKTMVRANNEVFDHEKGLAMAIAKKALGTNENRSNYYDEFKKWIPKETED